MEYIEEILAKCKKDDKSTVVGECKIKCVSKKNYTLL